MIEEEIPEIFEFWPYRGIEIDKSLLCLAETIIEESKALAEMYPEPIISEIRHELKKLNATYSVGFEFEDIDIQNIFTLLETGSCSSTRRQFKSNDREKLVKDLLNKHLVIQDCMLKRRTTIEKNFVELDGNDLYAIENSMSYRRSGYPNIEFKFQDLDKGCARIEANSSAEQLLMILDLYYICIYRGPGSDSLLNLLLLDTMLYKHIEGYGLWHISYSFFNVYESMDADDENNKSTSEMIEKLLISCLDEIRLMKSYLLLPTFHQNIHNHLKQTRFKTEVLAPAPESFEMLVDKFLIYGEISRGDVMTITGKKQRSATSMINQLLNYGYIKSDSQKGKIRMSFDRNGFSKSLFPDLLSPNLS